MTCLPVPLSRLSIVVITWPTFKVENLSGGNVTQVILENLTTGTKFQWDGTLANTKILTINMENRTIDNDGTDDIAGFTETFWSLAVGANSIKYTGGVTIELDTLWRHRWL